MKRKLWIILALAVLVVALWCGTALAEGMYVKQPTSTFRGSDCTFVISWETSFKPVRIKIIKTTGSEVILVDDITDATKLNAAMSWPIPAHADSSSTKYCIYAYSAADVFIFSNSFTNDWNSVRFTEGPTCSYMQYYHDFRIDFHPSFTPKKTIVYVFYEQEVASDTGGRNWIFVPFSKASQGGYWLRVYYGTGDSDYIENGYYDFDWDMVKFNQEPSVGINSTGDAFRVSWDTSYIPLSLEIWKHTSSGATKIDEITENLYYNMDYELPFTADADGVYYTLRAFYQGTEYRDSQPFQKDFSLLAFSSQPSGGDVCAQGRCTIQWASTFKPTRVAIGYTNDSGQFVETIGITENRSKNMQYELSYQEASDRPMTIRAFYNSVNDYKQSAPFTVTRIQNAYGFTASLPDRTIEPGQVKTIVWTTSFIPMYVTIGLKDDHNNIFPMARIIEATMHVSMSWDLAWDDAQTGTMYVRAYHGLNSYVETTFHMEKVAAAFQTSPQSGTIHLNEMHTLRWSTTFVPKKVEVVNDKDEIYTTITEDLKKSMSYPIEHFDPSRSGTYYVKAYYEIGAHFWENEYVYSNSFQLTSVAGAFTKQPVGGTVYPWTTRQLSWATNFVPAKVEIGYTENNSWTPVETLSSGLQKTMIHVLEYDQAYSSAKWSIRAYYGEEDKYIPSLTFTVDRRSVYVCGDDLTATVNNGTLTITGTGAMYDYNGSLPPWYGIRSTITKVVIGDGVTGIGVFCFYYCSSVQSVTIPTSVTSIGKYAFSYCSGLRYVHYNGFKTQWDAIDIDSGNTDLLNAGVGYIHRSGRLGTTNVYYELIGRDGSLWIYGSGGSTVHVTPPWADVAQYITEIRVEGIDTLWEDAFRDCTEVKKVYLDDSLTTVQDGAFNDCTSLMDIYYDGLASDWENIEILGHNEPLLNAALHTAPHEEQLTGDLSWSVNDEGLLRIWLDDSLMGDGEETAIPDFTDYTATPWYADYRNMITSLRIESGVTSIGRYAFSHLSYLRTIDIADTVTIIGNWSFSHCTRLEDFTLPDSVTNILSYTFQNCGYLEILHLPDSIINIGPGSFQNCYNLQRIWLPNQLTVVQDNLFRNCSLLDDIHIPGTVTSIGANAFLGCTEMATSTGQVYYDGPSAQWKQININATGNAPLVNCPNIHMTPEELRIDAANFPDEAFRTAVSNSFDPDHSGWLTDAEIAAADGFSSEEIDYTSVQGMGYFTEMTSILVDGALSLTSIDLTANTKLRYVDVCYNGLTEVNIEGLYDLIDLDISQNALSAFDVSDFDLERLVCYANPMTSLTLGNQSGLRYLSCYGTDLVTLDVRGCPLLLDCLYNGTKTVTANYVEYKVDNTRLLRMDAGTELIIPGMVAADAAHFPDPIFRAYVAETFDTNSSGWLSEEEIAALDEDDSPKSVYMYDAGITSLEGIQYLTELRVLQVSGSPALTSVDLSGNQKLTFVNFYQTGITSLDVSGLTLNYLSCDDAPLASLTLGSQPDLRMLSCYHTNVATVDISSSPHLIEAWLGEKTTDDGVDSYESGSYALYVNQGSAVITGIPAPTFTLPAGLTTIEAEAFSGIAAEAVFIPASVTSISGDPFAGSSVTHIYGLPGTAAETFVSSHAAYTFIPVTAEWVERH